MGYFFLSVALISGATKSFCGKKISSETKGLLSSAVISTIRMLLCVCIGFLFVVIETGDVGSLKIDEKVILISFLSALFTAAFVVSWLFCARNGALMMIDVFLTLGIVVPIVFGILFFNESVVWIKWIGIVLLVIATYIMCAYNNKIKSKMTMGGFLLLALCGVSNGATQFTQKWFVQVTESVNISVFNFYTYLFCAGILTIVAGVFSAKNRENVKDVKTVLNFRCIAYVSVMAVCLFLHSYFSTLSAKYLSSSQLYPLQQGASLILTMLVATVFFKEKITFWCIVGVILTFVALLLINVLPNFLF